MIKSLDELLSKVKERGPKRIAIAAAGDDDVLKAVQSAEKAGLSECILIDDKEKILKYARQLGMTLKEEKIIDAKTHREAAGQAVALVKRGKADLLMKGQIHTGEFLRAILDKENGLRTDSLLSQVSIFDKPDGNGLLFLTDCAMNIAPSIQDKQKIIENVVNLAIKLGYNKPKVALLAALEVVNPDMPDTVEAAVLSKMAERGQIKNAQVDGPLALDNAVSPDAAKHKGITGVVAGKADILVVPTILAGNILHKSLVFFAKYRAASLVLGARVPVIMTSRTDSPQTKLLSIASCQYLV